MNKGKKRFTGHFFIRLYLSVLVFLLSFFTLFAFRYDVLRVIYPDKQTAFALSEKRVEEVKQAVSERLFLIQNSPVIGDEMSKLIPEYSFSMYTSGDVSLQVKVSEGVETDEIEDERNEEQDYFYLHYGNAPNKITTEYSTTLNVAMDGGGVKIILYPKFSSFEKNYTEVIFVISILIAIVTAWVLRLIKKRQYVKRVIEKLTKRLKWRVFHKLALKLLAINLLSALFAFGGFYFMYVNRYAFFDFIDMMIAQDSVENSSQNAFVENIRNKVKDVKLNKANKEKITNILNQANTNNEVNYVYIYDDKGIYYTGNEFSRGPLETALVRNSIYDVGAVRTPKIYTYQIVFKGKVGSLMIYAYPLIPYVVPYVTVIVLIAISLFLIIVLGFFNKKVKQIMLLQEDVLILANGNLNHEIVNYGKDEIAQLAYNLDHMRILLNENIQNEEQSRKNNSELITSMSHDLRTPLTSIKAYLDILKYRKYKDDEQYEKCLDRCIKKTEDIKEMSDAMFEYSLVFEPDHQAQLVDTTLEEVLPYLIDQMEQIEMNHFFIKYCSAEGTCRLKLDNQMLKRIFNNIFSNILKYADVNLPVAIQVEIQDDALVMTFINSIHANIDKVERNHIGLKSTAKMMNLMHGSLQIEANDEIFTCKLTFAITS